MTMTNHTWLASLDRELEVLGLTAEIRAEILVETEGFLTESRQAAIDQFGSPSCYASMLATTLDNRRQRRARPAGSPVIEAHGLSKAFGSQTVMAEVSLTASAGEIVALIGPNGAGKSTLLRVLAGLETPDTGTVQIRGPIGYVPQQGGLDPYLRPREHFVLFGSGRGVDRRRANHDGLRLANELGWPDAATAPAVGQLSGGTAQKLRVIGAMLGDPTVLLMDEPYQGMDADSTHRFWELLWAWSDTGRTAVVSSHDQEVLSRAHTIIELAGSVS